MQQLNLQLYGRTTKKTFSEQLSARKTVTLTPQPTRVELSLKAPGREKFVELRLDPDDKPSTFVLHDLRVKADGETVVYRWDGSPESLTEQIDLRAWRANEDVLVETQSNDPFVLIPFAEPQSGNLVLELSVSQNLIAPDVVGSGAAFIALSTHQQELAEAVRSLQGSLRKALDDLASEQEGMRDALVVHHAYSRRQEEDISSQISQVLERSTVLEKSLRETAANLQSLTATFGSELSETRNAVISGVRDDWRSLSRQLRDRAEVAAKEALDREADLAASREAEFAKMMTALERLANSQRVMEDVRAELGVLRDDDAPIKIRQLQTEAELSRARIKEFESSFYWRLTRPFRR